MLLKYLLPLSEIIIDFFDQVKSLSSGYARYDNIINTVIYSCSFDYEDAGYQAANLVKV